MKKILISLAVVAVFSNITIASFAQTPTVPASANAVVTAPVVTPIEKTATSTAKPAVKPVVKTTATTAKTVVKKPCCNKKK